MKTITMSNYSESNLVKCLVHGDAGAGKTRFACTFPAPLILDFDKGLASAVDLLKPETVIYQPSSYNELADVLNQLENSTKYDSIVIDSLTTCGRMMMDDLLSQTRNQRETPSQNEWMLLNKRVLKLLSVLRDLPNKNVCITAQTQIEKNEVTGEISYVPALTGKLSREATYPLNNLFYAKLVKVGEKLESRLLTASDGIVLARVRSEKLERLEIPTFDNIASKLK